MYTRQATVEHGLAGQEKSERTGWHGYRNGGGYLMACTSATGATTRGASMLTICTLALPKPTSEMPSLMACGTPLKARNTGIQRYQKMTSELSELTAGRRQR